MGGPVRPSGYIGWASSGATNVAEPIDAKKAVGFSPSEKPPSAYFNWLLQKQDAWIQYLAWRTDLKTVVSDDFCVGDVQMVNSLGSTSMARDWYVFNPNLFSQANNWNGVLAGVGYYPQQGNGAVSVLSPPSGWNEFRKNVGNPSPRDMRMEFIAALLIQGTGNVDVHSHEMGLMYAHSGMSGGNMQCGFTWDSIGSSIIFKWRPSGFGATSRALGGIPSSMSGIHKYVAEIRGATNAIYVDDLLVAAVPAPGLLGMATGWHADTTLPPDLYFGVRVGGQSSGAAHGYIYLDFAELQVKK